MRVLPSVLMASGFGLLASQAAFAAAPPAGTAISNQATASYKDSTGAQQLTTSNTVVTTVTQVGAYTLNPAGNTKSAAAGATVYMAYVLTNTGNGSDTFTIDASEAVGGADFTKIEVFLDNGAGQPASTTPLCTASSAGGLCSVPKTLAANEAYKFVVAYTIPSNATPGGWAAQNTGTVKVAPAPGSTWLSTYAQASGDKSEERIDTVKLTTGVAFSVGKAIMAPAVAPVSGTWATPTSGPRGTETTYTISYSNTGASAGNLYIKDILPAGLTYVAGQSVISCAGGTALTEAADGAEAVCGAIGVDFVQSGQTIEAVIPSVQPVTNGTLSFKVTVANTATIGTLSNTASYTAEGCASATVAACGAADVVSSNAADFVVTASRGVQFNTVDTIAGTPDSGTDGVTTLQIVPGSFIKQTHVITNTGNASDTFNLSVAPGNFPTGTTFSWFAEDGNTPLLDTNSDGTVDTGAVADGAVKTVILQVFVPTSTTVASPANLEAIALAQSVNDPAYKDGTYAKITNVIGGYVDLTNSAAGTAVAGDIGPGPGQNPVTTTSPVQAGSQPHEISLFVRNNDSTGGGNLGSVTYSLAASGNTVFPGSLPAGWTVGFSSTACASATPITDVTVGAGAQSQVYACVNSPVTAPTMTQPVYFQVKNTTATSTGATAADTIYDAVSVVAANAYSFSLTANGSGSVQKGNNVDYSHTLSNTGANTCGAAGDITVTAALTPAQVTAGWTTAVYKDVDGNAVISGADTLITDTKLVTGGLAAGDAVKFIVRVYAPGGANAGDVSNVTVTVNDAGGVAPTGCGTQSNTDTTTVVTGSLTVLKKQATLAAVAGVCPAIPASGAMTTANLEAAPGDCIYYEVVATNNGASPVTNVSVSDAAPAYTTLQATPAPECTASAGTPSATPSGSTLSCGTVSSLDPAGNVTLRFAVRLAN
ncbi:MAG: beta strand repeat-containing protein [Hydrogenophaga sp.]